MIIVMCKGAQETSIQKVVDLIGQYGLTEHVSRGVERTIIGAVGDERVFEPQVFEGMPEVEKAMRVVHDWRIVSREVRPDNTLIRARGVVFGDIAHPVNVLASPAYTPVGDEMDAVYFDPFYCVSSPYQNQSATPESNWSETLSRFHESNKPVMIHIRDIRQLDKVLNAGVDILYLGSEFIDNRALQNEVRQLNTPLALEKGRQHTVHECLLAAEYIALGGNHQLMFCEAGTLHFDPGLPLRLDVEAIVTLKTLTHLPVLVNISGLGNKNISQELLKRVALTAGAGGVIFS